MQFLNFCGIISKLPRERRTKYPGVAKFGIALEWGSRGLEFESRHSDHENRKSNCSFGFHFSNERFEQFNATVRWTVACRRLDGGNTLIQIPRGNQNAAKLDTRTKTVSFLGNWPFFLCQKLMVFTEFYSVDTWLILKSDHIMMKAATRFLLKIIKRSQFVAIDRRAPIARGSKLRWLHR